MSTNDPTTPTPPVPPPGPVPPQQINIGSNVEGGSMGIPNGWWRIAGNTTAMAVIAGSFLYLQHTLIVQNREDGKEARLLFRETMRDLQDQDNRRAGEIKGALDGSNAATHELITEIKGWRKDAREMRTTPPPKGGPP